MSSFKKATAANVLAVLSKIQAQCLEDRRDAAVYAKALNQMLDDLLAEDFFGTEGQLDPRGDHR